MDLWIAARFPPAEGLSGRGASPPYTPLPMDQGSGAQMQGNAVTIFSAARIIDFLLWFPLILLMSYPLSLYFVAGA